MPYIKKEAMANNYPYKGYTNKEKRKKYKREYMRDYRKRKKAQHNDLRKLGLLPLISYEVI